MLFPDLLLVSLNKAHTFSSIPHYLILCQMVSLGFRWIYVDDDEYHTHHHHERMEWEEEGKIFFYVSYIIHT